MVSVREFRAVSSWARRNVADCRSWDDEQTVYRDRMGYLMHYTVTSIPLWLASFPYARALCVRDWPISATPNLHSLVHLKIWDSATANVEALVTAIDAGALPSLRVFSACVIGEREYIADDAAVESVCATSRRLGASLATLANLQHVMQFGIGIDFSDTIARAFFEGLSATATVKQLTLDGTHDWDVLLPFGRRLASIEKLWLHDDFIVDPVAYEGRTLWELLAPCTALKAIRFRVTQPVTAGGPIYVSLPSLTHVWMVDCFGDVFTVSFADEVRALARIAPGLQQIVLDQPCGGPVVNRLPVALRSVRGVPQDLLFGDYGRELRYGYDLIGYNRFVCGRKPALAVAVRRPDYDWAFKTCFNEREPFSWDSQTDSILAGLSHNCCISGARLSPCPHDVWPCSPCFTSDGVLFSPQHWSFSLQVHKTEGHALKSTTAVDVRSMRLGRLVHWAAFTESGPTLSEARLLLAEGHFPAMRRPPAIVSLRPDTLSVDWRTDIPGGCFGMATLPQQGVAVVATAGGLSVIRLSDGSLVGVFPTPCEQVYVAADAFSGLVFSGDSNVEDTGVNVWTWSPAGGPSGRGELVSAGTLPSAGVGVRHAGCAGNGGPPRPMAVMPAVPGDPDVTGHLIVGSHLNCTLRVIALPSLAHVHTYDVALPGHPTMGAGGIVGLAADPRGKTLAVSIAAGDLVDFALQLLPWPLPGSP